MKKIKVSIIGASGYAGVELLRLLLLHPYVEVYGICSRRYEGKNISELYPNFLNNTKLQFINEEEAIEQSDLIFASLPHGLSEKYAKKCNDKEKKFVDLGADFRLYDETDYKQWYENSFEDKALHAKSVYGLSEVYRNKIKESNIIGNPGCYPTAIGLALYPLLKSDIKIDSHIIIDAKSGATGAGKEPSDATHFANLNEGFHPYKVASHRHTPEIKQTLCEVSKKDIQVTFVPHLIPINRGILATMYVKLKDTISIETIYKLYKDEYNHEQFVRVLELGDTVDLKHVKYSNFCDISLHLDKQTQTLIIVSAIDNMVKGAAGQAIQNMNIMYDFKEEEGLNYIPPAF